ncbi:hypothetical protein [Acidiferrobacter sp.]|uniref:beta strand repeat-containing protein n=1 Tax=Acidiferrobacter sp. TaxID=1872107 RepID=UPI00262BD583|nr:hypothetical protein [Acidiferrobacter sp.]
MRQFTLQALAAAIGVALAPAALAVPLTPSAGSTAAATVNSTQTSLGSVTGAANETNRAALHGYVLDGASGNVGVNVSAGDNNMQGNNAAISKDTSAAATVAASAMIHSVQWSNAGAFSAVVFANNRASAHGNVLAEAAGNVGLNLAAGNNNMQANNLALAQGDTLGNLNASVKSVQLSGLFGLAGSAANLNTAGLSGNVLAGASGNIGVNVDAGQQNMAVNNLAMADNSLTTLVTASAENVQAATLVGAISFGDHNTASLSGNVLYAASGNVNVNVASGEQNMQSNMLSYATTARSSLADPSATSVATLSSTQSAGMLSGALSGFSPNTTRMSGGVLSGASGNIGVNEAAGVQNMQANTESNTMNPIVPDADDAMSMARLTNNQTSGPFSLSVTFLGDNDASLSGYVLQNAHGNIGVNLASGTQNMQANNLAWAGSRTASPATAYLGNNQGSGAPYGNSARLTGSFYSSDSTVMRNDVLMGAGGKIGVNVASGAFNGQANNLSMDTVFGVPEAGQGANGTATISDNQANNGALVWPSVAASVRDTDRSRMLGSVLQNASGQIGVNMASGMQNLQANNTAIVDNVSNSGSTSSASVRGGQQSGPWSAGVTLGSTNTAAIGDNVLNGAQGDIGVNMASGMQNMQGNDLAIAFGSQGGSTAAATTVSQVTLGAISANAGLPACMVPVANTATISGNAMQNVSGNIDVNMASGTGNLQRNTLTVATVE